VGHVAHHVMRQELERVRRALGEAPPEGREELVDLLLPVGVPPRTQDTHGLIAGPERPAWGGVAVVQGELRFVERALDPGQEVLAVGHAVSMLQATRHRPAVPGARTQRRPEISSEWRFDPRSDARLPIAAY